MYQRIIIVGNLGKDPEMRYTPSGVPVTTFPVAVNKKWRDAEGAQQEKVTWFRVTAWRKLAELANEYLVKGRPVLVEGEIDASAWTGQDGHPRASLELTAMSIKIAFSPGCTFPIYGPDGAGYRYAWFDSKGGYGHLSRPRHRAIGSAMAQAK